MRKFILCAALFLIHGTNYAADAQGGFSIRGAGLLSCDVYLKERAEQSKEYLMIGGWLDGYITGVNQYARETYDATSFESTELLTLIIENHCRKQPKDRLYTVVNSLLIKLQQDRLRSGSNLVQVKVGGRETILYKEVVRRMQQALNALGKYQGQADGQFNPPTQKALSEFQRDQKLEGTGFPDQTTLWRLLRQDA